MQPELGLQHTLPYTAADRDSLTINGELLKLVSCPV
jgi:hypothetical protein